MTNPTPQPTTTDAEVTPSADLLTAAPLYSAMKELLELAECIYIPRRDAEEHAASVEVMKDAQQALADAATIAQHSPAIWRVVSTLPYLYRFLNEVPDMPAWLEDSPEVLDFLQAYNALLPSVHDLVGRGGR